MVEGDAHIALVRAPNPSPMTLEGTNSYLVDMGEGEALVVDPGPAMERHVDAIAAAARERALTIAAIAITHGHPDHAPAAAPLRAKTGALVYAHPDSKVPRDCDLALGGRLNLGNRTIQVVDAPGHTFDHVVLYEPSARTLFTGDTIVGRGTVIVAPPGGSMRSYRRTLENLARVFPQAKTIRGGHGPLVPDAQAKIAEYVRHRADREHQVIEALHGQPRTVVELVQRIYAQTQKELWPAAARQLLAHLQALEEGGRIAVLPPLRELSVDERAMLNPAWSSLVDAELAVVLEAELGTSHHIERLDRYALLDA
ncbi:MAG: MBL fold metallo-hydrolase [Candidatus Tyrphobacter sp.]